MGIRSEESEMLTCIACSKQLNNGSMHRQEEEDPVADAATPRTKQAVKTLTAQVKFSPTLRLCLAPEKMRIKMNFRFHNFQFLSLKPKIYIRMSMS